MLIFDGLLKIALAEAEARAGDPDRAVAIFDEALATCDRLGHRAFEAELHRARGEILLRRDPANPASAEEAFQTAIAVAKWQGTRSFELRAALALAKLYQSTGRPAEAHAVLGPALEGFSPTPEMPEIAEAQALFEALAEAKPSRVVPVLLPSSTRSDARSVQRSSISSPAWSAILFSSRLRWGILSQSGFVRQTAQGARGVSSRFASGVQLGQPKPSAALYCRVSTADQSEGRTSRSCRMKRRTMAM